MDKNVRLYISLDTDAILLSRIKDETKQKLDIIETYARRTSDNKEQFYSTDKLVNYVIDYFLEQKGMTKKDMEPKSLEMDKDVLKHMRLDTNLSKATRSNLKNLCKGMVLENMIDKKPKTHELIEIMMENYIYNYPQLKKHMAFDEDIVGRIKIENIRYKRLTAQQF